MPGETATQSIGNGSSKRIPAYQRIEDDIRAKIADGRLLPGTMLASRHKLAREYGVALSTAQQAVANLIADGALETFDRRGTFVTHRSPTALRSAGPTVVLSSGDAAASEAFSSPLASAMTLGIVATARVDGAVAADVGSLWARMAIRSLEQVFSSAGGAIRFFDRYPEQSGPYPRGLDEANAIPVAQAIGALRRDGADAVAVVGLCDSRDMSDEVIRALDVEHVPTVYISWHEVQPPLAQVYYDNRYAGYQAAQHLLRQGYRQLVFVAPFTDTWIAERVDGARSAVRHAALPEQALALFPEQPLPRLYDRDCSAPAVRALALDGLGAGWSGRDGGGPFGVIAPNDDTAYAVLDAAAELGLVAGRHFGLVGFDDDPRAYTVGLTTVRPPVEAMGEEAGRLLLRALRGDRRGQVARLRSQLIPRSSTALRGR